jgi:hypothetical protein
MACDHADNAIASGIDSDLGESDELDVVVLNVFLELKRIPFDDLNTSNFSVGITASASCASAG